MATAADTKKMAAMIREEDLEDLRKLDKTLQDRIDQARGDGRVYIMGIYVTLLAQVKAEISRVEKRFHRESMASFRKEHKGLKKDLKKAEEENEEEENENEA